MSLLHCTNTALVLMAALCGALASTTTSGGTEESTVPFRYEVLCQNRLPEEVFKSEYSNLASPVTEAFSNAVKEFLNASFLMSDNSALKNSEITIVGYRSVNGSVLVSYVLRLPSDAGKMTLESIKFYIDFGIRIYQASGSRKLKIEDKTTVQEFSGSTTVASIEPATGEEISSTVESTTNYDDVVSEAATPMSDTATSMSDTATPMSDTATTMSDTATPMSDTATPMSDTATPMPDTATPMSDTATPMSDTATPMSNTAIPMSDTATPMSETATPMSDTATPMPETATPMPEPATPMSETATPMSETATPMPETASRMPDTETPMSETATPMPGPATTPVVSETKSTTNEQTTKMPMSEATAQSRGTTTAGVVITTTKETLTSTLMPTTSAVGASVSTSMLPASNSATPTTALACLPSSCRFGGRCINGACRCRPFRGGSRCEKRRTKVNCRNRLPRETFRNAYRDFQAEITIFLWRMILNFLLSSFRMSASASFREADFSLQLVGFEPGSVVTLYTLQFDMPDSDLASMSLEAIKSAIDSGIAAYSSTNSSNLTMEANTTVSAYNYCADTSSAPCSRHANCSLEPSTSGYSCTCWSGFRDEDTSAPGTTCTEVCTSSTTYCSGNGICRSNADARVSCECFSGYSGNFCQLIGLSHTLLAIVIVVPVLFAVIVVLISLIVWMHHRQGRFMYRFMMYRLQAGNGNGGFDGEDGRGQRGQNNDFERRLGNFPRATQTTEHPMLHQSAGEATLVREGLDQPE